MPNPSSGSDPGTQNSNKSAKLAENDAPTRTPAPSPSKRRVPANNKSFQNASLPNPIRSYSPSMPTEPTSRSSTPVQQSPTDHDMLPADGADDKNSDADYGVELTDILQEQLEAWREWVADGYTIPEETRAIILELGILAKHITPPPPSTDDVFMENETNTPSTPNTDSQLDKITRALADLTEQVREIRSSQHTKAVLPAAPRHEPTTHANFPSYSNAVKLPKKKATTAPKTKVQLTSPPARKQHPSTRNNDHRVLLVTEPQIQYNQLNIAETTEAVNKALEDCTPSEHKHYRFLGMQPATNSGRPVFITDSEVTADEILVYKEQIIRAIPLPDDEMRQQIDIRADKPRYLVAVGGVKRKTKDRDTTPDDIEKALKITMGKSNYTLAAPPRFLTPHERAEAGAVTGTILISFSDEISADVLLTKRIFWFQCEQCPIRRFNDRPPVTYCDDCHSLKHRAGAKQCRGKLCEQCGAKEHVTAEHPLHADVKCANCGGEHPSRSKECPHRRTPFTVRKAPTAAKKTTTNKKPTQ